MKFGSSWKIQSPCKPLGVDCPKRALGCHAVCEDFADYKKRLAEFKRNIFARKNKEGIVDEFVAAPQIKYTHGKKYER